MAPDIRFFTPAEEAIATALSTSCSASRHEPRVPVVHLIDARLAEAQTDGWHYDDMPADGQAWRDTLADLDTDARGRCTARASPTCSGTEQTRSDPGGPGPRRERLARTDGQATCGACGPATRAPRSTPIRRRGTRSASPAPPTPAATRTSASTGSSHSRCATPAPPTTRYGAEPLMSRRPRPQRVGLAAARTTAPAPTTDCARTCAASPTPTRSTW